jgi:hypothetical protein
VRLTYEPCRKLPIEDFLKPQGRFKHLFHGDNLASLRICKGISRRDGRNLGNGVNLSLVFAEGRCPSVAEPPNDCCIAGRFCISQFQDLPAELDR